MKIKLKSIHLRNFRIHEDYTFTPADNGVTAIVGANGRGKSSIIDGIAWALYGTKPNKSMKNSSWRRIQAPEDDPAYVDVDLELNDQSVRIKRSIVNPKNGGQQCECFLDGSLVAGPAVSHAEKWIVKTIGLDENSFLSTILVQQKHVDELVSAGQAERKRLLERLTGIEAVSRALQAAKDEARSYTKVADTAGADEGKLDELGKSIEENKTNAASVTAKISKLSDRLKELDVEGRDLHNKLAEMSSKAEKIRSLKITESKLSAESTLLADRMKSLMARRDDLKKDLPEVMASSADLKGMQKKLNTINDTMTSLSIRIADADKIIRSRPSDEDIRKTSDTIAENKAKLSTYDENDLKARLDQLNDRIALDKAKIKQSEKSLKEFDVKGVTECPTCLQPISDPDHVKRELDCRIESAKKSIAEQDARVIEVTDALNQVHDLTSAVTQGEKNLSDMKKRVTDAQQAEKDRIDLSAELEGCRSEAKALGRTINKFDADAVKRDEYERTDTDLSSTIDRSTAVDNQLASVRDDLKTIGKGFSETRLTKMQNDLDAKRSKRSKMNADLISMQGDLKMFTANVKSITGSYDLVAEQIKRRKDLLSKLEVSNGSVEILGKFRSHMILSSIPQVTDYASDLLAKITDGQFVSVKIDSKFDINVETDDGVEENSAQLSGGEMSLVAICLRLAISVMLSNGSPSLLILDEILTAMDEDRAAEILNAMQELSDDGQIIIVAHNEIIKSIADKVVEL
jgi:exonuclease SbcC